MGAFVYAKAHQILSAGGRTYRHDEAGNVVERPGSKLVFDAKERLKTVTLEDGTAISYRYDFTGHRVVKESRGPRGDHRTVYVGDVFEERDGKPIDYVLSGRSRLARLGGDEPGSVLAGAISNAPPVLGGMALLLFTFAALATLAAGQKQARAPAACGCICALLTLQVSGCDPGGGNAASRIAAVHYHGDHLGGTALLTGDDGRVMAEMAYDPWGVELAGSTEPYAFTDKEYEQDTGLYDFAARVYDPVLGRFLSPDPIAEGQYDGRVYDRGTGSHDYGARMYWPQIGTFISADPVSGHPEDPQTLNRYAYVLNSPFKYVDPDGRLTVIVHGTWARNADYARQGAEFQKAVSATFREPAVLFNWSGGNSKKARAAAAQGLAVFIKQNLKAGEKLNIVAHSHGGNVVKEYTTRDDAVRIDNLFTLGTPQRPDYQINRDMVGNYVNVYSRFDGVQRNGGPLGQGGVADRTDPAAANVEEGTAAGKLVGHSDLHTKAVWGFVDIYAK